MLVSHSARDSVSVMIKELPRPRSDLASLDSGATRTCALAAACLLMLAGATAARERPNVLFITVDDLNNDLGTYGHPIVQSPAIDRLAAEGMRFDAAYAQYPVCSPSRSSFLTGLYPQQTGIIANGPHFREFVPDIVTLPQFFAQHGYFTARVGKTFHYDVPKDIGTDGLDDPQSWNERRNPKGVDVSYTARVNTINPATLVGATLTWLSVAGDGSKHTDALVTDAAIDLLETHHPQRNGKPLFLAVGYFRPHAPFIAPSVFFELYPPKSIEMPADFVDDRADIPTAALIWIVSCPSANEPDSANKPPSSRIRAGCGTSAPSSRHPQAGCYRSHNRMRRMPETPQGP